MDSIGTSTKKELENFLTSTQNILDFARVNIEITCHLSKFDPDFGEAIKDNIYFFDNIRISTRRIAVIELYKLTSISKNDLHSFHNIFKKLKKTSALSQQNIESKKTRIQLNAITLKTVKNLRNKIYAHKDTRFKYEITCNYQEIRNLIILYQDIFTEIINELNLDIKPNFHPQDISFYNGYNLFNNMLLGKYKNN